MKNKTIIYAVIALVAVFGAGYGIYSLTADKAPLSGDVAQERETVSEAEKEQATEALRGILDVANRIYGITEGASFTFEPRDAYGRSGNFGLVTYEGIRGDRVVEEKIINFTDDQGGTAEVDSATGKVIAFHRKPHYGFCDDKPCDVKSQGELSKLVLQFLERVEPDFEQLTSNIRQYEIGDKSGGPDGANYFFTWNDMEYQNLLPEGVEADRAPFIQIGITESGFIFSYENTIGLYYDALESEALQNYRQ